MTRRLASFAFVVGFVLSGGNASATTAAHHPLYMPAVGQASRPALQPPPVCCAPIGTAAGTGWCAGAGDDLPTG